MSKLKVAFYGTWCIIASAVAK